MFSCAIPCNRARDPVCGNDGVTYRNWCYLRTAACKSRWKLIKVKSVGKCPGWVKLEKSSTFF